jgi:hypothetical protein
LIIRSSTWPTCSAGLAAVTIANLTEGSFLPQSATAFLAYHTTPPVQPWSAEGIEMPILISFGAARTLPAARTRTPMMPDRNLLFMRPPVGYCVATIFQMAAQRASLSYTLLR